MKSVLLRVEKRLSYTEDARCLKVKHVHKVGQQRHDCNRTGLGHGRRHYVMTHPGKIPLDRPLQRYILIP